MAVSVEQLANELRIIAGSDAPLPAAQRETVQRLLDFSSALVDEQAPNAPEVFKDQAVIQIATYRYDQPNATPGSGYSNAFRNSGAAATLGKWISRRAVTIEGAATADPTAGGTPSTPTDGVDQVARDAAAAAQRAADLANNKLMPPSLREADNATASAIRGWSAALVRRVVESIVPTWALADRPPAGSDVVDQTARDEARLAQTVALENQAKLAPPGVDEADEGASGTIRGWSAALIARVVRGVVPAWARTPEPPAVLTGGDQIARDAAAAAQTTADAAAASAAANTATLTPPSSEEAAGAIDARIRGWSAGLIRILVESVVPAWARQAEPPTGTGTGVTEAEAAQIASRVSAANSVTEITKRVANWAFNSPYNTDTSERPHDVFRPPVGTLGENWQVPRSIRTPRQVLTGGVADHTTDDASWYDISELFEDFLSDDEGPIHYEFMSNFTTDFDGVNRLCPDYGSNAALIQRALFDKYPYYGPEPDASQGEVNAPTSDLTGATAVVYGKSTGLVHVFQWNLERDNPNRGVWGHIYVTASAANTYKPVFRGVIPVSDSDSEARRKAIIASYFKNETGPNGRDLYPYARWFDPLFSQGQYGDQWLLESETKFSLWSKTKFTLTAHPDIASFEVRMRTHIQSRLWDSVHDWEEVASWPKNPGGLPTYEQAETQLLHSRAGLLFWDGISEVPDTPGTASSVGHTLTVTGENDKDYAWRANVAVDAIARASAATNAGNIGELQVEVASFAGSVADANSRIDNVGDVQSVTVLRSGEYQAALNAQVSSPKPLILVIGAAISGNRNSAAYDHAAGDVFWVAPTSDALEHLFTLPAGGDSDLTARAAAAAAQAVADANKAALDTLAGRVTDSVRDFIPEPNYWLKTQDARTIILHVHDADIPAGVTHIAMTIAGTTVTVPFVAEETNYAFAFDATAAQNAARNLGTDTTLRVNVAYIDDGTQVGFHSFLLRVLDEAPGTGTAPAGGGGTLPEVVQFNKPDSGAADSLTAAHLNKLVRLTPYISGGTRRTVWTIILGSDIGVDGDKIYLAPDTANTHIQMSPGPRQSIEFALPTRGEYSTVVGAADPFASDKVIWESSERTNDQAHIFTCQKIDGSWKVYEGAW